MPFLTDMLSQTDRQRRQQQALAAENQSPDDVLAAHRQMGGIDSRFGFDIEVIERHLRAEIIGQDAAVDSVIDMLRVVRADIADPRRPLYTSLLLGPTGVGKT